MHESADAAAASRRPPRPEPPPRSDPRDDPRDDTGGGPCIALRDVVFEYPSPARTAGGFRLEVEALTVAAGERVACIGPSGCGKTTLLHLCSGVLVPQRGTVELVGRRIEALADAGRRALRIRHVGMVFQQLELLEYLSVLDNILLPFHTTSSLTTPPRQAAARARSLAGDLGIAHLLARKPARLSQGERQRVAICRALVTRPDVVVCDEPTGNLDPRTTHRVLDELLEQVTARGAAVVMATHDHGVLDRFDRTLDVTRLGHDPERDGAGPV